MPPLPGQENPLRRVIRAVEALIAHPDSAPFREPVDWRGLELWDYPQVVSKMMDLGTIQRKIDRDEYLTAAQCAADVRLVWSNCMTYNAEGSDFYLLAKSLSRKFEDRYRKVRRDYDVGSEDPNGENVGNQESGVEEDDEEDGFDEKSQQTNQSGSVDNNTVELDAKAQLSSLLLLLNGQDLGAVMSILEQGCPKALESSNDIPELCAIDVDQVDEDILQQVMDYARQKARNKDAVDSDDVALDDVTGKRKRKR